MRIHRNQIESELLGQAVVELSDVTSVDELRAAECKASQDYQPFLLVCKIPINRVDLIQAAEELGLRTVECQLVLRKQIPQRMVPVDNSRFAYVRIVQEVDLAEVLRFAPAAFQTDRFSLDPRFGPDFSARRYRAFIEKSFCTADERLYGLRDLETGRMAIFHSFRHVSPTQIQGLLEAVHPERKSEGLANILGAHMHNLFVATGIREAHTAVSAANPRVLSRLCTYGGYVVGRAMQVFHKIYHRAGP